MALWEEATWKGMVQAFGFRKDKTISAISGIRRINGISGHRRRLEEIAVKKRWNSGYWHRWYEDLDMNAIVGEDILVHPCLICVRSYLTC